VAARPVGVGRAPRAVVAPEPGRCRLRRATTGDGLHGPSTLSAAGGLSPRGRVSPRCRMRSREDVAVDPMRRAAVQSPTRVDGFAAVGRDVSRRSSPHRRRASAIASLPTVAMTENPRVRPRRGTLPVRHGIGRPRSRWCTPITVESRLPAASGHARRPADGLAADRAAFRRTHLYVAGQASNALRSVTDVAPGLDVLRPLARRRPASPRRVSFSSIPRRDLLHVPRRDVGRGTFRRLKPTGRSSSLHIADGSVPRARLPVHSVRAAALAVQKRPPVG
jgi:hypothetical protein